MTNTNCDLCGTSNVSLQPVRSEYRVDGVDKVCAECADKLNRQLDKLNRVQHGAVAWFLKKFIRNLKENND